MELHVVRHTRPDIEEGICYGRLDMDCDHKYLNTVNNTITTLVQSVDGVYCSPLKRCTQLADYLGLTYLTDERLQEIDFGLWEGLSWNEIDAYSIDAWNRNLLYYTFPNGESFYQLCQRVRSFLQSLQCNNALLITHAGVIKALEVLINKKTPRDISVETIGYGGYIHFKHALKVV